MTHSYDPFSGQNSNSSDNQTPKSYSTPNWRDFDPLNPNESFDRALRYQNLINNQSSNKTASDASRGADINLDTYNKKKSIDAQYESQQKPAATQSVSGGGSSYGKFAAPPSFYTTDYLGFNHRDDRAIRQWETQQDISNRWTKAFSESEKAGDIKLAEINAQNQRIANQQQSELALRNQINQNAQSDRELKSKENIAKTQAQAQIMASLYSNIGGQTPTYRYWN